MLKDQRRQIGSLLSAMRLSVPAMLAVVLICLLATPLVMAQRAIDKQADEETLPLKAGRTIRFDVDEATWMSVDLSADDSTLVFDILGDIYTLPVQGGVAARLTSGMGFDAQPQFSPDGSMIAFVSDRGGQTNLWIMNSDGTNARKLSKDSGDGEFTSPVWSPDGEHVVVSRRTWQMTTYELWAYHVDGGSGVQLTKASADSNTSKGNRNNALGAQYSPDGRYLYYAHKRGGFGYNLRFPQWQIARLDLQQQRMDLLTQAQGSAFRPLLSPDGSRLVYATRFEQQTGLRIRDLVTGSDEWLLYPVEKDDQESRFSRDMLPGYSFNSDGSEIFLTRGGHLHRLNTSTRELIRIPFSAEIEQQVGASLDFPYRLGLGPVKARVLRDVTISPDGSQVAFSAFTHVYIHEFKSGRTNRISPAEQAAFQPAWSPDGKNLSYVTWQDEGGHIWRIRARPGGRPRQITEHAAFYTEPVWSPQGDRIVALRSTVADRLYREHDLGPPIGSDLIWVAADGKEIGVVTMARGLINPHFGPEPDRIYSYLSQGIYANRKDGELTSMRFDGTDRRSHITVTGAGIYYAEDVVAAENVTLAPDGQHALVLHAGQVYLLRLVNPNLNDLEVNLTSPSLPVVRLTDSGVDGLGWTAAGDPMWSVGQHVYQRPIGTIEFSDQVEGKLQTDASGESAESAPREENVSVSSTQIAVYLPRHSPDSTIALVGGNVMTMAQRCAADGSDAAWIENATVLIEKNRIIAVGKEVEIPEGAKVLDVSGKYLLPGFVDTHAHYRPFRSVLDVHNWSLLANLAYGVTTGLDVQPSTTDILAYQDLIDAGLMIGPRALSTGPAIFSNSNISSAAQAERILQRHQQHYGLHNLKFYIAGDRKQRQMLIEAAGKLRMMPTAEGSLDMKLDLTHVIDGFHGNEHNFPLQNLYEDVVQLVAQTGINYTPTLIVAYGGPSAENWYYTRENPHDDAKLKHFIPPQLLAERTLRTAWFHEREFNFAELAAQAAKIYRAGGNVSVGAHGQLQGLGYHWELWSLASGGLRNCEVLQMATLGGAQNIGVSGDIGSIEAGKLADVLVLNADPLTDIRNTTALDLIIKNGEVYDPATLDRLWPDPKALPDLWWHRQDPVLQAPLSSQ